MGRGKLNLELIENETVRVRTFKKRMQGLEKKAYEFSILCDVKVCMIVYEPKLKDSPAKVQVWPSDPVEVRSIIDKFKAKPMASNALLKRTFGINDFLNVKKRDDHVGDHEVAKVRKANLEAKFPTWDDSICNMTPEQICLLLTKLDSNIEAANRKLLMMKRTPPKSIKSDDYIPSSAFPPKKQKHSVYSHTFQADPAPAKILNYFDDIQLPSLSKKLDPPPPPIPAKPLSIGFPSHSPADDALVKLSLGLNPIPIQHSINPSLESSMMNSLGYKLQSGMPSSSRGSSMPNNVMYNPRNSVPVAHDPRLNAMPNNNVMYNPQNSVPVADHDPRLNAMPNKLVFNPALHYPRTSMINNVMLNKECGAPEPFFYVPDMQPADDVHHDQATYYQMSNMFPPMHPSDQLTDFCYQDINESEIKKEMPWF